jgi:hypothetical protein
VAHPVVEGVAESSTNTAGTSHTVTLPASIASTDLVLILMDIGSTSATLNALTDWTEDLDEASANGLKILRYTGAGVPSNPTFTSSASTRDASISYRISGADKSIAPQIATTATGTSATPDPPSVTPTGGVSKDYLFIAFAGMAGEEADDDTWANTPPTNYTPNPPRQKSCGTAGTNLGGLIMAAERQLTTGSAQDPGTFGVDVSAAWRAQHIIIHPPQAITPASVTVTATAGTLTVAREEQIAPAAVTVSVTPGTLVVTPPPQAITPGAVTVTATPGSLVVTQEDASLNITPAAVTVTATPGSLSLAMNVAPAAVSVSVTPGTLSLSQSVTPAAVSVAVNAGTLTIAQSLALAGPTVSVTPGSVSLGLRVTPVAVTVTVTPGSLSVVAEGGSQAITPAAVTVSVTPGSLTVTPPLQAVTPAAVTVTITAGTVVITQTDPSGTVGNISGPRSSSPGGTSHTTGSHSGGTRTGSASGTTIVVSGSYPGGIT